MLVLGIESSCDETAASVVAGGRHIRSNIIASQAAVHQKYGGVVPEIASRKHMEAIVPVVVEALDKAGATIDEIEGIAATRGPGLVGSLLVGFSFAKAFALARGIPFVGVNHLEGHIAAVFLEEKTPGYPFVALVVSGGHTSIYLVSDGQHYALLGQTRDDAGGEALDKAAKLLDIGYPGGVVIDRMATNGDRSWISFPRAMRDSLDFSFSGLKTALLVALKKRGMPYGKEDLPHVTASYLEAIVDVLVDKTIRAAELNGVTRIVVCGGVAANTRLRERIRLEGTLRGMEVFIPSPALCTDNAAMIAVAGHELLHTGERGGLALNAVSRWPLTQVA